MSKPKTVFKIDEIDEAVIQTFYLKFVKGWTGELRVEYSPDDKKLYISQWASPSSWHEETDIVFRLPEHTSIEDYGYFENEDGTVSSEDDDSWKNLKEWFSDVADAIFEDDISAANETLFEILNKGEESEA